MMTLIAINEMEEVHHVGPENLKPALYYAGIGRTFSRNENSLLSACSRLEVTPVCPSVVNERAKLPDNLDTVIVGIERE